jgi:SAM-dependent methyltransferase
MAENQKQQVREFYDQIGWSIEDDGLYQNAQYEDLRPVARDYIHKCHLRVNRYLDPTGDLFLDAGSGPVQYPEYLTYSQDYRYRVCADISITALKEARRRLGDQGLYVVMDIANLPFKSDAFDGIVSLHTIHHLPAPDHRKAYAELNRVLKPGHKAVVINGWSDPPLMRPFNAFAPYFNRLIAHFGYAEKTSASVEKKIVQVPAGTHVHKSNAAWLREQLKGIVPIEIFVWRSLSTKFTRTYVHERLAGRLLLGIFYALEEQFPKLFGEIGQYPIISFRK